MKGTRTAFILGASVAGALFAGYMSAVKLFSGACAFNEACPLFLGHPSCYFGFLLFLVLAFVSFAHRYYVRCASYALPTVRAVSFFGVLFAGYFTLGELPLLFAQGLSAYVLGLPTCALGFIFFLLIFAASMFPMRIRLQVR